MPGIGTLLPAGLGAGTTLTGPPDDAELEREAQKARARRA